ncbi:hypothetical protein PR001_g23802 [Phytophthora rubi]|uniref:Reverse transcriptase n=1 Tax=Phytophthora rubi TaxID=129364 RepID=A0A6A3IRV2_9STRA|nr:hypothetical protein PR001_g23802 [Phytophthora rubi]
MEPDAFRLKERPPQIYQRMLDNALYGFTRIPRLEGDPVLKQPDPEMSPNLIPTEPKDDGKKSSFTKLKEKVASTPILRHFQPELQPVVVVYANEWAISAALVQEHDAVFRPVMFASRTLKSNELNYGIVEKEGRLGQWAALLSPWTLEIVKCTKGEDEILGAIAATITPRAEIDQALIAIAPRKEPRRKIQAPILTVHPGENLWVVSFDGSARVKRGGGAYSAILWKLPEWTVLRTRSEYADGLTVNEAEYRGLQLWMDLLEGETQQRLVVCGDSNLVTRQVRGEIDCKAPGLTLLRQKALDRLLAWPEHELLHVKRDWNGSADSLASAALQRQPGIEVEEESDFENLLTLNRLAEILVAKETEEHPTARICPVVTRTAGESGSRPTVLQEEVVRNLRIERIKQAQDEGVWISGLKKYLVGAVHELAPEDISSYNAVGSDYEKRCSRTCYIITTPVWKEDTKESGGHTRGSEIIFIGEGSTAAYIATSRV